MPLLAVPWCSTPCLCLLSPLLPPLSSLLLSPSVPRPPLFRPLSLSLSLGDTHYIHCSGFVIVSLFAIFWSQEIDAPKACPHTPKAPPRGKSLTQPSKTSTVYSFFLSKKHNKNERIHRSSIDKSVNRFVPKCLAPGASLW